MSDANNQALLERSFFTTRHLGTKRAKISAWQESCSFIFDYRPRLEDEVCDFEAQIESYNFGSLITSVCQSRRATWHRSPLDAAANGVDHYLIQFYTAGHGNFSGDAEEGDFRTNDILVLDATRQTDSVTTDFRNLTLWVPRALLEPMVSDPDALHGRVLQREQPTTTLLRSHLSMLHEHAGRMTREQGEQLTRPTLELLAGALASDGTTDAIPGHTRTTALQLAVKHFIRRNLDHPELGADMIARAVNVSRATLYRVCESMGGVNPYIRQQRLRRVLDALANPALDVISITEIASFWGFDEPSSFHRLFRKTFGVTPGDARRYRMSPEPPRPVFQEEAVGDRKYERWLTGMIA